MVKPFFGFLALCIFSLTAIASQPNSSFTFPFVKEESYYKELLSDAAYNVCREKGTERAFSGQYDHFNESGTYYCACCGGVNPVFSSEAKFDSKTGWPSFTQPINPKNIHLQPDERVSAWWFGATTEVVCARCGSHLGHVFNDGPPPTHKRYCLNSVSLQFKPIFIKNSN